MAEHKACADLVAVTGSGGGGGGSTADHEGECQSGIDDSGTESGEEFRRLSPEILAEVQSALTRLEAALPGLDPTRRQALVRLVARLQSCLKLQPTPAPPTPPNPPNPPQPQPPVRRYANRRQRQQRHTVGVSREELADARRWLQETGQAQPSDSTSSVNDVSLANNEPEKQTQVCQVFRPVKFIPNQTSRTSNLETPLEVKALPQTDLRSPEDKILSPSSYPFSQEILKADSGSSLQDYDPSLVLFTPSQSVQIAVHKAAINKQISAEESKREGEREESNSEDGDESSLEEMADQGLEDAISSAQRLLQIASDKKTPTFSRFHDKNCKKQKMKRANTIDIPKPLNFSETEHPSYDGYETATMEQNKYINSKSIVDQTLPPPQFQPKTESDLKFLAFLKQANKKESTTTTYNPSARGGQPWTNRFVNLKTAFESLPETKKPETTVTPSVAQIWQQNSTKDIDPYAMRQTLKNRTPKPLQTKLPWNSNQQKDEEGVVIGSLTVKPAPGTVNKFSHAPKSAFRPIEKKPVSRPQAVLIQPQKSTFQPQPKPLKDKSNGFLQKTIINTENQHRKEKLVTSASGSVKQLATQKFSGENILSKPIVKQYPTIQAIQDSSFNTNGMAKQKRYVEQTTKPTSVNVPPIHVPAQNFSTSIASAHRFLTGEAPNVIKIPIKTPTKGYKDQSEYSPPKQYINSPPICKNYSEPFEYTVKSSLSKGSGNHSQESLLDDDSVPYYSQEPVYVQHSTYTQPLISYTQPSTNHSQISSQLQTSQEFPVKYSSQQYNRSHAQSDSNELSHKPEDHFSNINISLPSSFPPGPTSRTNDKREEHHRFSEEALVPNPIILGQIYKPSTPEYLLHEAPSAENNSKPLNNKPSVQMFNPLLETACYEPLVTTPNKPAIVLPLIPNNLYDNNSSQGSLVSSKLSDSSSSIKHYLNIPNKHGNDISPAISSTPKSPYFDESVNSSTVPSPQWNTEDLDDNEVSMSEGAEIQTVVAKVMGQAQCQQATTMSNRTKHRYDDDKAESESLLRVLIKSPTNMARKQSLEKAPNFTELNCSSKSPLMEKRNKTPVETYSYSNLAKPSAALTPHNDRLQNVQRSPISSAASAFRPLVKNLSKQPDSEVHKPPPIPPSSVKKSEADYRFSQTKTSPQILPHASNLCEADLLHKPQLSPCRSPSSSSPVFPNVLQKSESWHQLVKEQMAQGRHPPPRSPRLTKTKSSHSLAFPKQYEAHLTPEVLAVKQSTVDQYLKSSVKQSSKTTKQATKQKSTVTVVTLDDNLENVDEAFESLFQQVAKRK